MALLALLGIGQRSEVWGWSERCTQRWEIQRSIDDSHQVHFMILTKCATGHTTRPDGGTRWKDAACLAYACKTVKTVGNRLWRVVLYVYCTFRLSVALQATDESFVFLDRTNTFALCFVSCTQWLSRHPCWNEGTDSRTRDKVHHHHPLPSTARCPISVSSRFSFVPGHSRLFTNKQHPSPTQTCCGIRFTVH